MIRLLNGWNGTNVGAQGQINEVSWVEMFVQIRAFTTRWPTYDVDLQKLKGTVLQKGGRLIFVRPFLNSIKA